MLSAHQLVRISRIWPKQHGLRILRTPGASAHRPPLRQLQAASHLELAARRSAAVLHIHEPVHIDRGTRLQQKGQSSEAARHKNEAFKS